MIMDSGELDRKMSYLGMERCARKILLEEKLATADELAVMTCIEVCSKILDYYEVVSYENEEIIIVKSDDMEKYHSIVKVLSR